MSEKEKNIFVDNILKKFGKESGVIVQDLNNMHIEKFKTGSVKLNYGLKGGYPRGKIVEFSGDTGSGKTTLCIEGAVEFQKEYPDELILWVDLEDVYDPEYNESLGLDTSTNFILAKPKTGEQAWDLIVEFAKTSKGGLIVLDSVTLLLPESEDEGDMGDASMALAARMNSKGLRKLMPHLSKNKVTFFVVNQIREKIGGYGNPNVTTGGKGWAFYARTRIECSVQKGELTVSSNHRFKLTKATYGTKDFVVESSIVYGKGIDYLSEIIDMAVDMEIIKKAGSWFSYKETKIGQGKNAVKEILEDNPELLEEIENKLA